MPPSNMVPPARFSAQARLRALQSDIMELILDRELEAGDALPTENELCRRPGRGPEHPAGIAEGPAGPGGH